ncbi:MAG: DUF4214 domain-containing protein [Roseivivax sp.]|nr:DUF4214 domain-containing protein [Roseivivax sp.]
MPTSVTNAVMQARAAEFLANSATAGDQRTPSVAALSDGHFIAVWHDGGSLRIKGQLFTETGLPIGRELTISSGAGVDSMPVVAGLSGGGFAVAWNRATGSASQTVNGVPITYPAEADTFARRFDNSGAALAAEERLNADPVGLQLVPGITALAGGGYFVSYLSLNGYDPFRILDGSLVGTIYTAAGTAPQGEFLVNNLTYGLGMQSDSAGFADGRFVTVWDGVDIAGQDRSGTGISLQMFNADGTKSGGVATVNQTSTGIQIAPRVAVLNDGNFVVVWNDWLSGPNVAQKFDIHAQVFSATGAPIGNEFRIANDLGVQREPEVTAAGPNGFVVSWTDESGLVGAVPLGARDPSASVKAQYFQLAYSYDDTGAVTDANALASRVFQINQVVAGPQREVSVDQLDDQTLVFSWADGSGQGGDGQPSGIRTQVVTLDLAPEFTRSTLPGVQLDAAGYVHVDLARGRVFDPEGDSMTFRLLQPGTNQAAALPSWLSFDTQTGALSGTYTGQALPQLNVDLEARDSHGAVSRISGTIAFERAGLSGQGVSRAFIAHEGLPERFDAPGGGYALVYSGASTADTGEWRRNFVIESHDAAGGLVQTQGMTAKTPYTDLRLMPVSADGGTFTADGYVLTGVELRGGRDRVVTYASAQPPAGLIDLDSVHFGSTNGLNGLTNYAVLPMAAGGYQIFSNHQPVSTLSPGTPSVETALYRRFPSGNLSILDYFHTQDASVGATVQGMTGQLAAVSDAAGKSLLVYERYKTSQFSPSYGLGYAVFDDVAGTVVSGALGRPNAIGQSYAPLHPFRVFDTDLGYFVVSIHEGSSNSHNDLRVDKATGGYARLSNPVNDLFYLSNGYSVSLRTQNGLSIRVYDPNYAVVVDDYDLRNSTLEIAHLAEAALPGEGPSITDLGGGRFRVSGVDANGSAVFEDFAIDALQATRTLTDNADTFTSAGTGSMLVRGQAGGDRLTGSAFADTLMGEAGADTLIGGGGADRLLGGDGDDELRLGRADAPASAPLGIVELANTQVIGGAGTDTVVLTGQGYLDLAGGRLREVEVIDFSRSTVATTQMRVSAEDMHALLRQPGGLTLRGTSTAGFASGVDVMVDAAFAGGEARLDLSGLRLESWGQGAINIYATVALTQFELTGSAGRDSAIGTGSRDVFILGGGADRGQGAGGDDVLIGDAYEATYAGALADQVFRLYRATLARDPDVAGYTEWTRRMDIAGTDLRDVAASFVGSTEFQRVYGALSNAQFVELLYQNVLGRASDAAGRQGWLDRMTRGEARESVVLGFSESGEFVRRTQAAAQTFEHAADDASWGGAVYRLYGATLARDPDAGGFAGWTGRLAAGATLVAASRGFVASAEFQATYGTLNNGQFVDLIYQNVLGRAADAAGRAHWVGQLNQGVSREQVVLGFSESPEFKALTAAAQIAWGRGLGPHDRLEPGGGDNVVAGGLLSDTFVFDVRNGGSTRVLDLEPWDTLELRGFGYADAAAAISHMTASGADVVFADQGVTVVLQDTTLAEVTAGMIVLL